MSTLVFRTSIRLCEAVNVFGCPRLESDSNPRRHVVAELADVRKIEQELVNWLARCTPTVLATNLGIGCTSCRGESGCRVQIFSARAHLPHHLSQRQTVAPHHSYRRTHDSLT